MSETRTVELFLAEAGHSSRVLLDGEEVKNCRSVVVKAGVGEATTVTFELINMRVLVHGQFSKDEVKVVDVTPIDADTRRYGVVPK